MRFTPEFLDELRARLPVSEVVGRRVKLKKAGREWKGLSPFQQEKTPSFFVNDQKQAWFALRPAAQARRPIDHAYTAWEEYTNVKVARRPASWRGSGRGSRDSAPKSRTTSSTRS